MPSKRRESRLFPTRTGGWQVWIGNAGGTHVRKGDLLETVGTREEPVRGMKIFFLLPRERTLQGAHLRLRPANEPAEESEPRKSGKRAE